MAEFILFLVLTTQVPYLWHADPKPYEMDESERCEILKDQAACELVNEE